MTKLQEKYKFCLPRITILNSFGNSTYFPSKNFEFISTLFVFYKITSAPRNYTYRVLYTFENMKKRRFFAVLYK